MLGPVLSVAPAAVSFGGLVGGAQPGPATVDVGNNGGGTLSFTAASDTAWLSVSPTGGTAPRTLQLTASTTGLAAGSYTGHVTVTAAGAGGSPATVTATLVISAPSSSHDWLQIEHDARRTGQQTGETAISPANAGQLSQAWATTLDGKVTAQPLYAKTILVGGTSHDVVVAATSANSVYALDAVSGAVLWRRSLGSQTNANCAIPGGYGVTAAPVIDRAAGRIYTVADNGSLRSLALADGSDAAPALAVIPNSATNKVWGGLTLNGTDLYVSTASDGCDTPPWRGVAYRIDVSGANPRLVSSWTVVPSIAAPNGGGGVWGYGGVSADPATGNVYAATGADSNEAYRDYANSMVALNANLGVLGFYQPPEPNTFPCNGAPCDLDFGSTPLVFTPPGCPTLVATGNKNGNIYVERATDLAASANPFQTLMVNATNDWLGDGGVGGTPAYWADGNMVFVGTAGGGLPGISAGIVGLRVGSDCRLSVAWSAGLGGNSQPNSTVTVANGVVFIGVGSTGRVHAFDAITGAALWTSGAAGSGSAAYAAPIVADGRVFAGYWNGVTVGDAGTIRAFALPGLSVSISAPANNATVNGSVAVSATATGAAGVQFRLDGNDARQRGHDRPVRRHVGHHRGQRGHPHPDGGGPLGGGLDGDVDAGDRHGQQRRAADGVDYRADQQQHGQRLDRGQRHGLGLGGRRAVQAGRQRTRQRGHDRPVRRHLEHDHGDRGSAHAHRRRAQRPGRDGHVDVGRGDREQRGAADGVDHCADQQQHGQRLDRGQRHGLGLGGRRAVQAGRQRPRQRGHDRPVRHHVGHHDGD